MSRVLKIFQKIKKIKFGIAICTKVWYNIMVDRKIIRRGIEVGTFASAAGGRRSEQKGVAAVEILRAMRTKNFGHRNRT